MKLNKLLLIITMVLLASCSKVEYKSLDTFNGVPLYMPVQSVIQSLEDKGLCHLGNGILISKVYEIPSVSSIVAEEDNIIYFNTTISLQKLDVKNTNKLYNHILENMSKEYGPYSKKEYNKYIWEKDDCVLKLCLDLDHINIELKL